MGELSRLEHLRSRLLPAGVSLAAIAPEAQGLTLREWDELCWLEWQATLSASPGVSALSDRPITTARDRYGWRSLPGGTPYFGVTSLLLISLALTGCAAHLGEKLLQHRGNTPVIVNIYCTCSPQPAHMRTTAAEER
jgi:hypothetical protein